MAQVHEYLAAKASYDRQKMQLRNKLGALTANLSQIRNKIRVFTKRVESDVNNKRYMEQIMEMRFRRQADRAVGGTKWGTAESPSFKPLLQGTGRLKNAAINAVVGTYRIDHQFDWRVPASPSYARAQNYGSAAHDIPPRPFMKNPNDAELRDADNFARREFNRLLKLELRK